MNPKANLFLPSVADGFDDYTALEARHYTLSWYNHSFFDTDTRIVAEKQPFIGLFFNLVNPFRYTIKFPGTRSRTYRVNRNDFNLLYVPQDATVTFEIASGRLAATVINFSLSYLDRYLKKMPSLREFMDHVEAQVPWLLSNKNFTLCAEITDCIEGLFERLENTDMQSVVRADAKAKTMGHTLVRLALRQIADGFNPVRLKYDFNEIFALRDFLARHLDQRYPMNFLAATTGIGKNKIRRGIKGMYKTNLPGLIARLRVQKAKVLLRDYSVPISEIARCVGCSPAGLSRIFKRETGYTPRSFRSAPDIISIEVGDFRIFSNLKGFL